MPNTIPASPILIWTKEEPFGEVIAQALVHLGYEARHVVGTVEDVIRATRHILPALLLVDLELFEQLENREIDEQVGASVAVPVVCLADFTQKHLLQKVSMSRVHGFIDKDATLPELKALIDAALGKLSAARQSWEERQRLCEERKDADVSVDSLSDSELLFASAFDALSARAAIIDEDGFIVAVNDAWRRFGQQNGACTWSIGEGANYVQVCDSARGKEAEGAPEAGEMIRELLAGRREELRWEYPCQSPSGELWLVMHGTRFHVGHRVRVLLVHEIVSERQTAEADRGQSHQRFRPIVAQDVTEVQRAEKLASDAVQRLRTASEALKRQARERKKAETELVAARKRYQLVCEQAPLALSIMLPDGTFEYLNPRFTELFGYTIQDLPHRAAWTSTSYPEQDQTDTVRAYWDEIGKFHGVSGSPSLTLAVIRCKRGERKVARCRTVDLDDGKQICVYRDVTREIELQEHLLKAKNDWERTFDAVSDLIMILDKDKRIVRVNKAVTEFLGLPFKEIIGETCYSLIHAQDRPPSYCPHSQIVSGQEEVCAEALVTAKGKSLSVAHYPLWDQAHQCIGTVFVGKDVTEQRARENQLKFSEQRFRAIFESTRDPMFIKDASLKYALANPAMVNLVGIKESEFIGHGVEGLFSEDSIELLKDSDARVLAGQTIELELATKLQGEPALLLLIKTPLVDGSGSVAGICGIIHDLTGRKPVRAIALPEPKSVRSRAMRLTLEKALRAAQFDTTILLAGETGAGKDYLAKFIHQNSKRSGGPYFVLNCASLPSELAESELFGHEGGAFTGAKTRKRGILELAEGGTLLLNEIGELPLALQAKLLTFLDTRQFLRVGGEYPVSVNARLIAATNRDLEKEAANGTFRFDLLYRLNVYHVTVPPLRERLDDLATITRRILASLSEEFQLPAVPRLSAAVLEKLGRYRWPGNVRELRNVLERALILSEGGPLSEDSIVLPEDLSEQGRRTFVIPEDRLLNEVVAEFKRVLVDAAVKKCHGNKTRAARLLGIPRSSLINYQKT